MDEALKQPLLLRAMTLRGIGPYLRGARLEIRPLTILCGKNGSGKSTWFKVLNVLERAHRKGRLPFAWNENADWSDNLELTNAFVHFEDPNRIPAEADDFGPPGTIGFEWETTESLNLGDESESTLGSVSPATTFIWAGRCPAGTRLRIRLAQPTHMSHEPHPAHRVADSLPESPKPNDSPTFVPACGPESPLPGLAYLAELRIDDDVIYATTPADSLHRVYTLHCSPSFLPTTGQELDETLPIARFAVNNRGDIVTPSDMVDGTGRTRFAELFVKRIRQLFDELFESYYYLSAIRRVELKEEAENRDQRWVGGEGQYWSNVESSFGFNEFGRVAESERRAGIRHDTNARPPVLNSYVAFWIDYLLPGTRLYSPYDDGFLAGQEWLAAGWSFRNNSPTNGSILEIRAKRCKAYWNIREFNESSEPDVEEEAYIETTPISLRRIGHPLYGPANRADQPPRDFSTGFHQLIPIIVQSGVIQPNEVLAIENPEVHLHPSLQLQVAEFLLHQAQAGKIILVETHSDLIVRRVLRAILEEIVFDQPLSQALVRIYFAGLDKAPLEYQTATLEPLRINDHGQIENWPPGFMDDDVLESRLLLDAMYGPLIDDEESDEE